MLSTVFDSVTVTHLLLLVATTIEFPSELLRDDNTNDLGRSLLFAYEMSPYSWNRQKSVFVNIRAAYRKTT